MRFLKVLIVAIILGATFQLWRKTTSQTAEGDPDTNELMDTNHDQPEVSGKQTLNLNR